VGGALVRVPLPDGTTLEAILDEPSGPSAGAVVVCHPHPAFGGRMDTPLIGALARGFVASGRAALRFHFRGIEGSDGVATGGLVEHEDVAAAHRWLIERGHQRIAWVGYSFGALMALRAIADGLRPQAYVGVALPTSIIGDDAERVASAERAIGAGVPSLFVSGADDPLCDAARLRAWCAGSATAAVETRPGEGHVFSIVAIRAIVQRAVAFVEGAAC
jgi:alpha/beta superfamily hydrolase